MLAKKNLPPRILFKTLISALILLTICSACGDSLSVTATSIALTTKSAGAVPETTLPSPSESDRELSNLIANLEAGAVNFPVALAPTTVPHYFQDFKGTAERKCVDIEAGRNDINAIVRSGEFVLMTLLPTGTKAAWNQLHQNETTVLTVKAWKVGNSSTSLTFGPFRAVIGGAGYPSAIDLPSSGIWVLVATVEANWGCFIVFK